MLPNLLTVSAVKSVTKRLPAVSKHIPVVSKLPVVVFSVWMSVPVGLKRFTCPLPTAANTSPRANGGWAWTVWVLHSVLATLASRSRLTSQIPCCKLRGMMALHPLCSMPSVGQSHHVGPRTAKPAG